MDRAHCILKWRPNFCPTYTQLSVLNLSVDKFKVGIISGLTHHISIMATLEAVENESNARSVSSGTAGSLL